MDILHCRRQGCVDTKEYERVLFDCSITAELVRRERGFVRFGEWHENRVLAHPGHIKSLLMSHQTPDAY